MKASILKAIAVTAELTGTELSEAALRVMAEDLDAYPEQRVLHALDRCRRELKTRMTLAAVLERIADEDGRPGADEAWATAITADNEAVTVVWTDETAQAFDCARPLLECRDKVGARMAFRDAYERLVSDARDAGMPCRWSVSLGHDAELRDAVLDRAAEKGLLTSQHVAGLLTAHSESPVVAAILENRPQAMLGAPDLTDDERELGKRRVADLLRSLRER